MYLYNYIKKKKKNPKKQRNCTDNIQKSFLENPGKYGTV